MLPDYHQGHSTGVERLALYRVKSVEGQPGYQPGNPQPYTCLRPRA